MKKKNFAQIYGYVTAGVLAIAAICLVVQCIGVYRTGSFTPEKAAAALSAIGFVLWPALLLSLGSIPVSLFAPRVKDKSQCPKPTPLPKALPGWVRYAMLGAAIALTAFGYFAGGWEDVLTKAVNICTECVGLG